MSKYRQIKKRVYEILGPAAPGDTLSLAVDIFVCVLVLLSSVTVVCSVCRWSSYPRDSRI